MHATLYTLVDENRLQCVRHDRVPDPETRRQECETAWLVLLALNFAICGHPVGPCRQLRVFHQDDA